MLELHPELGYLKVSWKNGLTSSFSLLHGSWIRRKARRVLIAPRACIPALTLAVENFTPPTGSLLDMSNSLETVVDSRVHYMVMKRYQGLDFEKIFT